MGLSLLALEIPRCSIHASDNLDLILKKTIKYASRKKAPAAFLLRTKQTVLIFRECRRYSATLQNKIAFAKFSPFLNYSYF